MAGARRENAMLPSEIGAAVKAAREERGLSIKELARYTRLGPRIISRLEQGYFDRVSALEIVCAVLGLTLTISVERAPGLRRPTLYELVAQNEDEARAERAAWRTRSEKRVISIEELPQEFVDELRKPYYNPEQEALDHLLDE